MLTARQQPTSHALEEPNGAAADAAGAARPERGAVTDSHPAYECERESERVRDGRGRTKRASKRCAKRAPKQCRFESAVNKHRYIYIYISDTRILRFFWSRLIK